jgi:hypothetical protein
MNFKEEKEFQVNSSSLKDIRNFARELFEKVEELEQLSRRISLSVSRSCSKYC